LSIAEVQRDTGLGKDTLRVWERRYGFPAPGRDAHGERVYPADQLQRLRLVKRLLDAGHRPGRVVSLDVDALHALCASLPQTPPARLLPGPGGGDSAVDVTAAWAVPWLTCLARSRSDVFRQDLQRHILHHGLAATLERLVSPLCHAVGDAWLRGELTVFQEHLFTETLQSVLREAMAAVDAASAPSLGRPRVLLTTLPFEPHGLGVLMAQCLLALAGCERHSLGTATPVPEIVAAAQALQVDVVALSFSLYAGRRESRRALEQLRQQLPGSVALWIGGAVDGLAPRQNGGQWQVLTGGAALESTLTEWRRTHGVSDQSSSTRFGG